MKIKCITKKSSLKEYVNTSFNELEIGTEHIVYGIELWNNCLHYLIIYPKGERPSWYPAELFKVTDPLMNNEWYFSLGKWQENVNAIWGYKELMDPTHYENLLERRSEDMTIFRKRKQEIDEYESLSSYIPKKSTAIQMLQSPKVVSILMNR